MNNHILDTIRMSTLNIAEKLSDVLPKSTLSVVSDKKLAHKQIELLVKNKLNLTDIKNKSLTIKIGSPLNALVSEVETDRGEVEDIIVKKIGNLAYFYKRTAFPAIKNQIAIIKDSVENSDVPGTCDGLKVKYSEVPNFVLDIEKTQRPFDGFTAKAVFGRNIDRSYLKNMDDDYFDKITDEEIQRVWNIIVEISNTKDTGLFDREENEPSDIYTAYGIISSLGNNPVAGSIGNITEYNKLVLEMYSLIETRMLLTKKKYFIQADNKTLINKRFKNTLWLNKHVAGLFFKESTIEILFGYLLSRDTNVSLQFILDNMDKYKKIYNETKIADNVIKKNAVKEIYGNAYISNMKRLIDMFSCCHHRPTNDIFKDSVRYIKSCSDIELMDIKNTIETLVMKYIVPQTGLEKFINDLTIYTKQAPDLRIEEIVGLAIMDTIVDILLEGVVVQ